MNRGDGVHGPKKWTGGTEFMVQNRLFGPEMHQWLEKQDDNERLTIKSQQENEDF